MPRLIARAVEALDAQLRRCWIAWRYFRALGYAPRTAWVKAKRSGS